MPIPALPNSFSTKRLLRKPWVFLTWKMQNALTKSKLYVRKLAWIPQTLQMQMSGTHYRSFSLPRSLARVGLEVATATFCLVSQLVDLYLAEGS